MAERSRFWGGTTVGDATTAPYDAESELAAVLRSLAGANAIPTDRSGVWSDEFSALAASTGGASPVVVASGRALVDGTWYESDTATNVAIPSPVSNPRIDRIVLRKSFAGQTVRITRIAGTEAASPVAPAIIQSAGVTWDMPICQVRATTIGGLTVTDERKFIANFIDAFGDGSDGDVTISTTVTLARDMYYNNLVVAAGGILRPNGFKVFCRTSCNIQAGGVVEAIPINGNNAAAGVGGALLGCFTNGNTGIIWSAGAGGNGSASNPSGLGSTPQNSVGFGGLALAGPFAATGGSGGGSSVVNPTVAGSVLNSRPIRRFTQESYFVAISIGVSGPPAPQLPLFSIGGSGGSGGIGDGTNLGGGGGGGGQGPGSIWIYARTFINSGTVRANGGNGGAGATGTGGTANGGGGGGGGSGGFIYIVGVSITSGTIQVNGGSGGAGGLGAGGSLAGSAGGAGGAGRAQLYNIATQTWTII